MFVVGVWMCARVVYAWMSTCVCVCVRVYALKKKQFIPFSVSPSPQRAAARAPPSALVLVCGVSQLRLAIVSIEKEKKNYTQDHESMFLNLVADNFIHAIYKKSIAWKVLYPVCIEWVKVLLFIKQITTIHNSSFTLFVSLS